MSDNPETHDQRPDVKGLKPIAQTNDNYDATLDARTGRPPNPLEAQRLAREHEEKKSEHEQIENESPHEEASPTEGSSGAEGIEGQKAARMVAPQARADEKDAAEALIQEGVSRERAEELIQAHGTDWETLKAAASI